jgi:hypothetical protein
MLKAVLISLCISCSASAPEPDHARLAKQDILADIDAVTHESVQRKREKLADNMLGDIILVSNAGDIGTLDNTVIRALLPLLDDDSDIVRGWAACGLKYFGPRARMAVPFLQRAEQRALEEQRKLTEHDKFVMAPTQDSTDCIEQALTRIQGASE